MIPEVIVVLGMHRSGTSAVTRGLKSLGVELGAHLIPPGTDNPRGFWENGDILSVNARLLAALGLKWDSPSLVPPSLWDSPRLEGLLSEATRVVEENLALYPRWGFKDPRTLRVLPFWIGVFTRLGLTPGYLLVIRNPVSVARSLYARNGIAPEKAYLLWSIHIIAHLRRIRNSMLAVVDYDIFLANPVPQLKRIAARMNIPVRFSGNREITYYAERFLSPGLRHTYYSPEDVQRTGLPDPAKTAYHWLLRLARDELGQDAAPFWRQWSLLESDLAAAVRQADRWDKPPSRPGLIPSRFGHGTPVYIRRSGTPIRIVRRKNWK